MSETLLKNQILDYLKYKNIFCWLTNVQGTYNRFTNTYYKNPRLLSGVADIIGVLPNGRFFAIECKVGKNKQTPSQIEFQKNIEANQGVYMVATQLEGVETYLKSSLSFPMN
jgi:hypothetical protein